MLLNCKLGDKPVYIAHFPDGTQIQLPQAVHATLELMCRFTDLSGKRLKDIASPDELAAAVEAFCKDLARMYAQAADALPWALLKLAGYKAEEPSEQPG